MCWKQQQVTSDQPDTEVLPRRQENCRKQERQLKIHCKNFPNFPKGREYHQPLRAYRPVSRNVTTLLCCFTKRRILRLPVGGPVPKVSLGFPADPHHWSPEAITVVCLSEQRIWIYAGGLETLEKRAPFSLLPLRSG